MSILWQAIIGGAFGGAAALAVNWLLTRRKR